jgi:hypothetical protein
VVPSAARATSASTSELCRRALPSCRLSEHVAPRDSPDSPMSSGSTYGAPNAPNLYGGPDSRPSIGMLSHNAVQSIGGSVWDTKTGRPLLAST